MKKNYLKMSVIAVALLMIATSIDAQIIPSLASAPVLQGVNIPAENALKIKANHFTSECITDYSKRKDNNLDLVNLYRNKIEIEGVALNKCHVSEGSVIILDFITEVSYASPSHAAVASIKFSNVTANGCDYKVTYLRESDWSFVDFEKPTPPVGHFTFDAQGNIDFAHLTIEDVFDNYVGTSYGIQCTYALRFAQNSTELEGKNFVGFENKTQLISNQVPFSVFTPAPVLVQEDAKFSQWDVDNDTDHHLPANEFVTISVEINPIDPDKVAQQYDIYRIKTSEDKECLKIGEIKHEIGSNNYTVSALDDSGVMQVLFTKTVDYYYENFIIEDKITKSGNLNLNYAIVAHIDNEKYKGSYGSALMDAILVDKLEVKNIKAHKSKYNWTENSKKYCYYTVTFDTFFDTHYNNFGVSPYLVRAWRECDIDVLGEELESRRSRLNSSYLFDAQDNDEMFQFQNEHRDENETLYGQEKSCAFLARLGANSVTFDDPKPEEKKGTFGARMVGASSDFKQFTCNFRVRVYYEIMKLSAPGVDKKATPANSFYIEEYIFPHTFTDEVSVGIDDTEKNKVVKNIIFHNLCGMASSVPFDGMNIVVTTFSDGTTATQKIMK